MRMTGEFLTSIGLLVLIAISSSAPRLHAQNIPAKPITHPWDNQHLSADVRADLVLQSMTLEEKIFMLRASPIVPWEECEADLLRLHSAVSTKHQG